MPMRERGELDSVEVIRGWLADPASETGVHLAQEGDGWTFRSYADLADDAWAIGAAMAERGVAGGDGVCVVLPTDLACAAAFYAVWARGGVCTPIAPPTFGDLDEYTDHVAAILAQARPQLVVTAPGLAEIVAVARGRVDVVCEVLELAPDRPLAAPGPADRVFGEPGDTALLQFTSGSTGTPRGVRISWANLATNTAMISDLLDWQAGEPMASWLPLYHDMGLVGGFITTVTNAEDLYLMRPDQFVRDPARWLRAMTIARHTPSPSFALGYVAHRVSAAAIADADLSGWRTLAVGSEPVELSDLLSFTALAGPRGFDASAFTLAYGLAESTLMVSSSRRDRPISLLRPAAGGLRFGAPVIVAERAGFDAGRTYPGTRWIAGLGCSLPDSRLGIIDADGRPLPDGVLGEVTVTGGSVALGYADQAGDAGRGSGSTRIADGTLHTGDAGFLLDGELYVLGRMGSSLKVRGRSVFAEDLESTVSAECGITKGKLAAVAIADAGSQGIALFAETAPGPWIADARTVIRAELGPAQTVTVVTGPRGLIHRTSSGKPRRRHMWQLYTEGRLAGAVSHEADGTARRPVPTLSADRVAQLLDTALGLVSLPGTRGDRIDDGYAILFEGSLAEGFGNEGSDVDYLVVAAGEEEMPTLPSVLFGDGRRLEVRTRSVAQLRSQLLAVADAAAGDRIGEVTEDLLNRCQRFLRATIVRPSARVDLDELTAIMGHDRFAEIVAEWWRLRTRAAMRHVVALRALGATGEAAGWAADALVQGAKAWCASRGETYLETKWLPRQLDRIAGASAATGDESVARRCAELLDGVREDAARGEVIPDD
ncbi:MAG: DUF6001 family protein, partial [Gordonia sp. (in: high G+C Gram-positive bacteria)]